MSNDELVEAEEEFINAASYLINEFGISKEVLIDMLKRMDVNPDELMEVGEDYEPIEGLDF